MKKTTSEQRMKMLIDLGKLHLKLNLKTENDSNRLFHKKYNISWALMNQYSEIVIKDKINYIKVQNFINSLPKHYKKIEIRYYGEYEFSLLIEWNKSYCNDYYVQEHK